MKNFRFLKQPSVDEASMERRWSVDGGSMEDQTPRNGRIAELQNCTTGKTSHLARFAAMLLMLITMSVGQVWAEMGFYDSGTFNVQMNVNGSARWLYGSGANRTGVAEVDLGEVSSLTFAGYWINAWSNNGWKHKSVKLYASVDGGAFANWYEVSGSDYEGNKQYKVENKNIDKELVAGKSAGEHIIKFYFALNDYRYATNTSGQTSAAEPYYVIRYSIAGPSCTPNVVSWTTAPANGEVGGSMTIGATATGGTVQYVSSNTSVATIVGTTLNYVSKGSATITARVKDDATYCDAQVTKNITVSNPTYTFANGSTWYFDFSQVACDGNGGVNWPKASTGSDYDASGCGSVKTVTFTQNRLVTLDEGWGDFKTQKGGWNGIILPNSAPTPGQNSLIVSADGKRATWGTYNPCVSGAGFNIAQPGNGKVGDNFNMAPNIPGDVVGATVSYTCSPAGAVSFDGNTATYLMAADPVSITATLSGGNLCAPVEHTTNNFMIEAAAATYTITLRNYDDTKTNGTVTATLGSNVLTGAVVREDRGAGFTFKGYYTAKWSGGVRVIDDAGRLIADKSPYTDASGNWIYKGDVTLIAGWSGNRYTITFDNQGATTAGILTLSVRYSADEGLTTPIEVPAKTDYTFGGYYTAPQGGGLQVFAEDGTVIQNVGGYVTNGKWMKAANVTLYAKWTENVAPCTPTSYTLKHITKGEIATFTDTGNANEYELTFELKNDIINNLYVEDNCGNVYGCSTAIEPGQSITLTTAQSSFNFQSASQDKHWHYTFNSETKILSCDAQSEEEKAVTTYLIQFFNYNVGAPLQSGQVEEGKMPVYTGATPTRESDAEWDYTFDHWEPAIHAANENQNYSAVYTPTRRQYTLTWDLAGGNITTPGTAAGSVANASTLTAPVVEKTGYTFAGWSPAVSATMPAADATYTATWTPITYDITYNLNGGAGATNRTYTIETETIVLPTPTKDGFMFGGWYDNSEFTGSAITQIASGSTGNKTFYAKWNTEVCVYVLKSLASGFEVPGVAFADHTTHQYQLWAWDKTGDSKFMTSMSKYPGPNPTGTHTDAMGNVWYKFVKNNADCADDYAAHLTYNNVQIFNSESSSSMVDGSAATRWAFAANTSAWIVPGTTTVANSAKGYTTNPVRAIVTYTITINNGDHGTVSPTGEQQVGATGIDLTVTPDAHYYHNGWSTTGGASMDGNHLTATEVGSVTAEYTPSWSVRGTFNSWSAGNYIEHFEGNTGYVDIVLAAGQTYEFKIFHHGGSEYSYNGGHKIMTENDCTDWTLYTDNNNSKITTTIAGTYRFTFNTENHKLSITYPTAPVYYIYLGQQLALTDFMSVEYTAGNQANSVPAYYYNSLTEEREQYSPVEALITAGNNVTAKTLGKYEVNVTGGTSSTAIIYVYRYYAKYPWGACTEEGADYNRMWKWQALNFSDAYSAHVTGLYSSKSGDHANIGWDYYYDWDGLYKYNGDETPNLHPGVMNTSNGIWIDSNSDAKDHGAANYISLSTSESLHCGDYLDLTYTTTQPLSGTNTPVVDGEFSYTQFDPASAGETYHSVAGVAVPAIGGIVTNDATGGHVLSGSAVTFAATANDGFDFVGWYTDEACTTPVDDATVSDNRHQQTITADYTVYAKFARNATLSIAATATATAGQTIVITPTTNQTGDLFVCYHFDAMPDGSTASFAAGEGTTTTFVADKAGTYTISAELRTAACPGGEQLCTATPISVEVNANNYHIYIGYAGAPVQSIAYDNGYSIELEAGKEYDLKVVDEADPGHKVWYGNKGTMTATNHTGWTFSSSVDDNAALATTLAGTYTFDLDVETMKLTAHYPELSKEMYASAVRRNDPSVMIQAYYWTHGKDALGHDNDSQLNLGYGDMTWSSLDAQAAEIAANFDLVWLAPSQSTADWTGFLPVNYSDQNNRAWGTETQLKTLINDLHAGGAKVIADIVLNHSNASTYRDEKWEGEPDTYTHFQTMNFGSYGSYTPDYKWITLYDEVFLPAGDANGSPFLNKGMAEALDGTFNFAGMYEDEYGHSVWQGMSSGTPGERTATYTTTDWSRGENDFWLSRDWAHRNRNVREMSRAYLTWMRQEIGYDGFRYDFMKGFHCSHIDDYNRASGAEFSVMEVFDGALGNALGVLHDAHENTHIFDFPTKFVIKEAIGGYNLPQLKNNPNKVIYYPEYKKNAIVFAENHDSFRESGNSISGTEDPTIQQLQQPQYRRQILQANAYILAMPGVPCVFYPHWAAYKQEINAMIAARKAAGVTNESTVEDWAGNGGSGQNWYTAQTTGEHGSVFIKLGVDCNPKDYPYATSGYVRVYADDNVGVYYKSTDADVVPTLMCNKESQDFVGNITGITLQALGATNGSAAYDIHFTTDGSEPTPSSTLYSSALTFTATTPLKAIAYKHGDESIHSSMVEVTFTKVQDQFTLTHTGTCSTGKTAEFTMTPLSNSDIYTYTFQMREPGAQNYTTFYNGSSRSASYTFPGGGWYNIKVTATDGEHEYIIEEAIESSAVRYYLRHPFNGTNPWQNVEMTDMGDGTYIYYNDGTGSGQESLIYWANGANVGTLGTEEDPYFHSVGSAETPRIINETDFPPVDNTRVVWVYNSLTKELKVNDPAKRIYRVAVTTAEGDVYHSNNIPTDAVGVPYAISFFAAPTATLTLESMGGGTMEWTKVADLEMPAAVTAGNVYTSDITVTAPAEGVPSASLAAVAAYAGSYYIYSANTSFDPAHVADASDRDARRYCGTMTPFEKHDDELYDHYWVEWLRSGDHDSKHDTDTKYTVNTYATVGNLINTNLAAVMPQYYLHEFVYGVHEGASVRYGYDPHSNYFSRVHLDGSTAGRMLVVYGENVQDTVGNTLANEETGIKFHDVSNWMYEAEILGNIRNTSATDIKLAAQYNGAYTYLFSATGADSPEAKKTLVPAGSKLPEPAQFHLIYDYKTNRIMAGWDPADEVVTESTEIDNIIVVRKDDDNKTEFTITGEGSVFVAQQMTTQFIITRDMWDNWHGDTFGDTKRMYFWFSLPYSCMVSDVFGFSQCNVGWEIQRYRGDLRSAGTAGDNAWRRLKATAFLEPYRGYVLMVELKRSDFNEIELEDHTKVSQLSLFFPSAGPVTLTTNPTTMLDDLSAGAAPEIQRDWHVMGVPLMKTGGTVTREGSDNFRYYDKPFGIDGVRWYEAHMTIDDDHEMRAMNAYMVQGHGTYNWQYPAPAVAPSPVIARAKAAEAEGGVLRLDLMEEEDLVDRTYVEFAAESTRAYEMSADMEKILNPGRSMLYSEQGDELAVISIAADDQDPIALTLVAAESAQYTLRLHVATEGLEPVLYDAQEDLYVMLNQNDYTIDLTAGTYKDRFYLQNRPRKVTTDFVGGEATDNEGRRIVKYLEDGKLYILREGKIYNAEGRLVH